MTTTATGGSSTVALVQGEPISYRSTRVLLGWLPDSEAIRLLLGRNPVPGDELADVLKRTAAARNVVQQRPPVRIEEAVLTGDRTLPYEIQGRPELQSAFADVTWRVEWVDLTRVIALQKFIVTDGLDLRVGGAREDPAALAELCLPATQVLPPQGGFTDGDGLGFTVSSLNPNLRAVGSQMGEALVAPAAGATPRKMQGLTFFVTLDTSYLQVARYQGRYFLRDGYHRAAGLLRAGVNPVPAVVVDAASYQYVASQPGLFDYEVAFSDRPPMLSDFWDDTVAADGTTPAVRKVIRIRADQFFVQG